MMFFLLDQIAGNGFMPSHDPGKNRELCPTDNLTVYAMHLTYHPIYHRLFWRQLPQQSYIQSGFLIQFCF
jgi:hypothetical protein